MNRSSHTGSPISIKDLDCWISAIKVAVSAFRARVGVFRIVLLTVASYLLAAPRLVPHRGRGVAPADQDRQYPWLPRWPWLAARPIHRRLEHPWTDLLRQAHADIRRELLAVAPAFTRAKYDSSANPLPWTTYYFYLQGRSVAQHLATCPKTARVLARIPHNGLHVCFSAIPPGGSLHPHTGPTNASLTAHLGLADCEGATLHVGGRSLEYGEGDVLVFDDSFVHWVEHAGSRVRYTLMVTFWHPELHALERGFLRLVLRTGGDLAP